MHDSLTRLPTRAADRVTRPFMRFLRIEAGASVVSGVTGLLALTWLTSPGWARRRAAQPQALAILRNDLQPLTGPPSGTKPTEADELLQPRVPPRSIKDDTLLPETRMTSKSAPPSPAKEDRNTHELSGDEARPAESRRQQTGGGGHRSGSRGAGTFENSDGKAEPGQGPSGSQPGGRHPATQAASAAVTGVRADT